jgi:GTP-binding protein
MISGNNVFSVALVGRPNVGKSTLFNRLSTDKKAIVHDYPGVTRDRKYSRARIASLYFTVIDTPGLENADEALIESRMMGQAFLAMLSADIVCLIIDGECGVTPADMFFANMIRKSHSNVLVVVNKCERKVHIDNPYYKLGFGDPVCISAEHGLGMVDLHDALNDKIPEECHSFEDPLKSGDVRIAICGRPNTGKSTFVNAILGSDRVLTGPEAGITRDSVEIEWQWKDRSVKLIDTAGMRRKNNISDSLEHLAVSDSIHSIKFANTVVLMIDASDGISHQDMNILNFIVSEGRGLVLVLNKWDLVSNKTEFFREVQYKINNISGIRGVRIVCMSAIHGTNVHDVIDACIESKNLYK